MPKIYITRKIPDIAIKMLKEKGFELQISKKDIALSKQDLIKILKKTKYDGLITLLNDTIDKEVLSNCQNVKIIANYAVGLNNIDLEEAKKRNILVGNASGTSSTAVAQHVVALVLSVMDRIIEGDIYVRKKKWKGWDPNLLMGKDLYGKTIGLIGTGNIGQKVAETFAKGFNCKILYTDMNANKMLEDTVGAKKVEIDELLQNSDVVSLHVPLLPTTKHLINEKKLKMMKPESILINTARGGVVDEKALIRALKKKQILGAGLDVFETEPKVSSELLKLGNVVMSPHIASAKDSARTEMAVKTALNVINAFK